MSTIDPQAAISLFVSADYSDRISNLIDEWHVPGISISLVCNSITTFKAFGRLRLDSDVPCTPSTLFDIASCSKSLTAGAVGLLVADNDNYPHVQWDTPVSRLLPDDFIMSKEDFTRNITVEDILSHRTGFPNHDASYLGVNASQPDTPKSVTQNLRNLPLSAGLRTKFQYCNQMFTVAAYLVEVLSGMPFADFLQKRIFDPLGMQSTFVQPEVAQRSGLGSNLSVGYQWSQERKAYFTIPYQNVPEAVGAGSIVTSTTDYIKWVQAMLSQSSPLSPTLVQDLIAPRIICNGSDTPDEMEPWTSFEMYALGWEVYFYRGVRVVRHGGSISGFSSLHFFLPEHGLGGALFGNSDSAADVAEVVMQEIIDEMLGVPAVERPDWNARKWDAIKKYEQVMAEERQDVIDELCPGFEQSPPLKDVERYVGHYWNEGYHGMKVTIREGELFVDASDRSSNGFVLKFEHVRDDTLFVVELTTPYESGDHEFFKAEFRIEDGMVVKMGLKLEPDMEEMIWFDRQRRS